MGRALIDDPPRTPVPTDAGKIVLNMHGDSRTYKGTERHRQSRATSRRPIANRRNESSTLYLLDHIEDYRRRYPKIKVQVRRSLSSKIPSELIDGELELGLLTYDPEDDRLIAKVIFTDHLAFVVSPRHRFAAREEVSITGLGMETFIAHNVVSPYRGMVIREFQRHKVELIKDLEIPTIESIRKMVERNEGVAFLPKMCVKEELRHGLLREVKVREMEMERKIRLVYPARRTMSHAAQAFLEVVGTPLLATDGHG